MSTKNIDFFVTCTKLFRFVINLQFNNGSLHFYTRLTINFHLDIKDFFDLEPKQDNGF